MENQHLNLQLSSTLAKEPTQRRAVISIREKVSRTAGQDMLWSADMSTELQEVQLFNPHGGHSQESGTQQGNHQC